MRILHYLFGLPPVYVGGLVGYVCDLAEEQMRKQKVDGQISVLLAGPIIPKIKGQKICDVTSGYQKELGKGSIPIYEIINALPVSYGRGIKEPRYFMQEGDYSVYYRFLSELSPELIHVHSLMGIHLEFFQAARQLRIPIVFTTHDYYGLCPRATFYHESGICYEENWYKCGNCCSDVYSYQKIVKEQSAFYRKVKQNWLYQKIAFSQSLLPIKRKLQNVLSKGKECKVCENVCNPETAQQYVLLQEYYRKIFDMISYFHFNSEQTAQIYKKRLNQVQGEIIPVLRKDIVDHRTERVYKNTLHIGYLGGNNKQKGFHLLFEAAKKLWDDGCRDFELQVYGNYSEEAPYFQKNAPYRRGESAEVFNKMDALMVPSIWQETFGLVAMEAISYGVPVIVSEYVGAKEILGAIIKDIGYGHICEYGVILKDVNKSIYEILKNIYNDREFLAEINKRICAGKVEFWTEHLLKMQDLYERSCRDFYAES